MGGLPQPPPPPPGYATDHVSIAWIPGHSGVYGNKVADCLAKSGSKSKIHRHEPFITIPYASCISTVKNWSKDRWKSK